jgi:hypothetical protein
MGLGVTNLRDWQKKASERRDALAVSKYPSSAVDAERRLQNRWHRGTFKAAYSLRDAEIDLLLQIIEKQSETISFYADKANWYRYEIEGDDVEVVTKGPNEIDDWIGGKRARTTQAEVQQIVERLTNE